MSDQSYRFLLTMFKRFPNFRATLNVAGTLLETFERLGLHDILTDLQTLLDRGQIELTGSAHFHAFLPKLPRPEIERQILLQEQAIARYFNNYRPKGFFPPELAYSALLGDVIKDRGYEWIILDPMCTTITPDEQTKYRDERTGLTIVLRNRTFSRSYPPESLFKLTQKSSNIRTIVTATDAELYGHFHTDWQDHLKQIMESPIIQSIRVSDHIMMETTTTPVHLHEATWETRSKQLKRNNPFSIWYNSSNPIHRRLWNLVDYAIQLVGTHQTDPNWAWAREHLDRGLASCSFWWASEIKTSPFAPRAWNPDEVESGARELIHSIRSLQELDADTKLIAEKIYFDLLHTLWKKHWRSYGVRTGH